MREIKFRAWVKSEKRYITDTQDFIPLIVTNKGVMKLQSQFKENYYEILPFDWFVLEQFTGLHDKNGVEIYEGDKILYTDNFKVNGTTSHISVVEWVDEIGGFYIKAVGIGYYNLNASQCEKYSYEVIGNIHERS